MNDAVVNEYNAWLIIEYYEEDSYTISLNLSTFAKECGSLRNSIYAFIPNTSNSSFIKNDAFFLYTHLTQSRAIDYYFST